MLCFISAADFNLTAAEIIFNSSSNQAAAFTVEIIDDIIYEPFESVFNISIVLDNAAGPLGATLGEDNTATIHIIDNDS